MDSERLKSLRWKTLIWTNVGFVFAFVLLMLLISLGMTTRQLFVGLAILMLSQALILLFYGKPLQAILSANFRELHEYEKEKLETEWPKQKKLQIVSQLFVTMMVLFNAWMVDPSQSLVIEEKGVSLFYAFLFIATIALLNGTVLFHAKKIDGGGSLQGYTGKMFLFSLLVAILISAAIFIFIFIWIMKS